jgi:hypothetical protein
MRSDPLGMNVLTSYRTSAIHLILTQRQSAKTQRPGAPGLTPQEPE